MGDPADKTMAMVQALCPVDSWDFVEAFLGDPELDIGRAEKAVGWPRGAGARALADARVRNTIAEVLRDADRRHASLRDKAIYTLAQIAFYDPADAWNEEGTSLAKIRDMPENVRMAITEYTETIKTSGEIVVKVKFADRVKVLDMVLKMFGALDEEGDETQDRTTVILRGVQLIEADGEG